MDNISIVQRLIFRIVTGGLFVLLVAACLMLPRFSTFFAKQETLYVYTFSEFISFETVSEFEKKHDVKVSLKYFDTNEELLAKFNITGGKGYDLITPTDYMVELLRRKGLLQKLDLEKLPVFKALDKRFLKKYYDPDNQYSLPFLWAVYGFLYHKSISKIVESNPSLALIFENPNNTFKFSMLDDTREICFFASWYLFNDIYNFSDERLNLIKKLLLRQKKYTEMYVEEDPRYYLLSDTIQLSLTSSSYIKRLLKEGYSDFAFIMPKEGSLLVIENLAIPVHSKKVDLVYKFINFVLSKNIAARDSALFGTTPTNKHAYELLDKNVISNKYIFPHEKEFDRLSLMHNNLPIKKMEKLWMAVKGS